MIPCVDRGGRPLADGFPGCRSARWLASYGGRPTRRVHRARQHGLRSFRDDQV